MNSVIQPGYGAGIYNALIKARGARQSGARTSSFLDMAAQAGGTGTGAGTLSAGMGGVTGVEDIPAALMMDLSVRSAGQIRETGVEAAEAPTLETMLKAKYPGLVYHVFDASSGYWKTRNDYPHYLLYREGDQAKETLENWKPTGENPFYGSKDGRFIAPKEIHALGSVPPGSKAVVIHPAVQERMDQDPAYAREIMAKIDAWFAFDVARNEAVMPGSTAMMSQAVAIGEDGNICNACSSSCGGTITQSSDEMVRAYYLRMAKRADFMRWLVHRKMEDSVQARDLAASAAARTRLAAMMSGGKLQAVFGSEIAGVPTETVLSITQAQVWGGGAVL